MSTRTIFAYYIDLDERGTFRADVRDQKGKTVFEIEAPSPDEDMSTIFEDGYMRDKYDLDGLTTYLRELGVIPVGGEVLESSVAEPLFDEIEAFSRDVVAALGTDGKFHQAVGSTNFVATVDEDDEPFVQFELKNSKQWKAVNLVTLSPSGEDFDAELGHLSFSDNGVSSYWAVVALESLEPGCLRETLISEVQRADKSVAIKLEGHLRTAFTSVLVGDGPRVAVPGEHGFPLSGLRLYSGAALELDKINYLIEHSDEAPEDEERSGLVSINYTEHPVWLVSDTDDLAQPLPFDTVSALLASPLIQSYLEDARAEDTLATLDEDTAPAVGTLKSLAPGA